MITLEKISAGLIDIDSDHELEDNFVGIAIQINDGGIGSHSGLVIGVDGEYYLFHYGGRVVDLENPISPNQKFFCKKLDVIDSDYSINFLAHCETLLQEDPPSYGFFFDGSYYDSEGRYFTQTGVRNYTTCVGFCINVITGFLNSVDQYFMLEDWDETSMSEIDQYHPHYFNDFFERVKEDVPQLTEDDFKKYYKRITPAEYTASAYLSNLPVRRIDIDTIINNIREAIRQKVA